MMHRPPISDTRSTVLRMLGVNPDRPPTSSSAPVAPGTRVSIPATAVPPAWPPTSSQIRIAATLGVDPSALGARPPDANAAPALSSSQIAVARMLGVEPTKVTVSEPVGTDDVQGALDTWANLVESLALRCGFSVAR